MIITLVSGKLRKKEFIILGNKRICNFEVLSVTAYNKKVERSPIRCTAYGKDADIMEMAEKGDIVVAYGTGTNMIYNDEYRFNLACHDIQVIRNGEFVYQERSGSDNKC